MLDSQVHLTSKDSDFVPVAGLPQEDRYFAYNARVNAGFSPTEEVIDRARASRGEDYRLETEGENPVEGLRRGGDGRTRGYSDVDELRAKLKNLEAGHPPDEEGPGSGHVIGSE